MKFQLPGRIGRLKRKNIFDMDRRDLLVDPPTVFERLSGWEFSDRFYSSLGVFPLAISSLVSIFCFLIILNEYTREDHENTISAVTEFRLFIATIFFSIDFLFYFNDLFLTGRALKLYEACTKNKRAFDTLTFEWRELLLALFWILNSFVSPIFLLVSLFMIGVILSKRFGFYPKEKNETKALNFH